MNADDVVLVAGLRTPFSPFGGPLKHVPSVELGAFVLREVVARAGVDGGDVDEIFMGVTIPAEYATDGSTLARNAMLKAGLPLGVRSVTLDRACCSSMTAIQYGGRALQVKDADVVIAGGCDNMGRAAFLLPADVARWGHKRGPITLKDPMWETGADIGGKPVAVDAGEVAVEHGITREMQDEWAYTSQMRAAKADAAGIFADEVIPLPYSGSRGEELVLEVDATPRPDTTVEKLASLKTVYGSPTVTAGNAPGLDTGATATMFMRRETAEARGLEPIATVRATHSIAREAREIAVAPATAISQLLDKVGWRLDDVDVIEVNEAFAAVALTSARLLAGGDEGIERSVHERLNVNGGAVALGHPPGASGARLVLTAALELKRRGGGRATAAICGGLGQADAVAISVP